MAVLVNESSTGGRGDLLVYVDISNEAERGHYQRGSTENCSVLSKPFLVKSQAIHDKPAS
jgi:hypothetical protein